MNLPFKIIDRYIMKKFILTFFLALVLIIGIVIIFDISEKIDDFVSNSAPLKAIVFNYYVNFIPYFMNMFSPLFVFITVIFFTSRMASNTEIVAILSGGISYGRMMVPFLTSALLIATLSLSLNLWVIPRANADRLKFEAKYIKHHNVYKRNDIHYQIAPGEFVYVQSFSEWNKTAYRFTLETIDGGRMMSKLSAESATWDSTNGAWKLRNYFLRDFKSGMGDVVKAGPQMDTVIPLTIVDFYRNEKTVQSLPAQALNELIATQKMRGDSSVIHAQIEKHTRLAMPFSAIILTIMGVSLSSRKKRGGTGWNIGVGIALAFSYILFQRFAQMFVMTGSMSPALAMWLPNFLYAIIAAILVKLAPK